MNKQKKNNMMGIITREKRTKVNHSIREISGVEDFIVMNFVRSKSVVLWSHLHKERRGNGVRRKVENWVRERKWEQFDTDLDGGGVDWSDSEWCCWRMSKKQMGDLPNGRQQHLYFHNLTNFFSFSLYSFAIFIIF